MDLSIIIINWNTKTFLRECLASIRANAGGLASEVIVIDNASYDGCREMLRDEFPGVRFIQSDQNLGFARANNRAAREARGEALLFLNPDTLVEADALSALLDGLRTLPGAGAVGPRLLNSDRTLQTSCVQAFPTVANQFVDSELLRAWFPQSRLWGMGALFSTPAAPAIVEGISGACVMVKRSVFHAIKGFEEAFFMYGEDIDLGYKLRQAGLRAYYIPCARVVHHGGGGSAKAPSAFSVVMMRESVYRFMRLRRGRLSAGLFRLAMGLSALVRLPAAAVLALLHGRASLAENRSIQKWRSILRWSVGMERWAASSGPLPGGG